MRAFLVAALLLAGCASTPTSSNEIILSFATQPVAANGNVTFDLHIAGPAGTSDHIGGHYWNATQSDPTATFSLAKGCVHVAGGGSYPNTFHVTCVTGPGMHYVRGHMRITANNVTTNYWTPEVMVMVE